MAYLIVFLGSGIGGAVRYGVNLVFEGLLTSPSPLGTLFVNVIGSLLMGLVVGLFDAGSPNDPGLRLFLATGLLGGFTTFSAFSLDVVTLYKRGEFFLAFAYASGSLILSLSALLAGLLFVRWLS